MSKYDILLATIAVGFCLWATYTDMRTGKLTPLPAKAGRFFPVGSFGWAG